MSETTQTRLDHRPPGAGKGTQAARIAERYGVPARFRPVISPRANIQGGTELGQQVQAIIKAGELVPIC